MIGPIDFPFRLNYVLQQRHGLLDLAHVMHISRCKVPYWQILLRWFGWLNLIHSVDAIQQFRELPIFSHNIEYLTTCQQDWKHRLLWPVGENGVDLSREKGLHVRP